MGKRLTDEERDDRKWSVAIACVETYGAYVRAIQTYGWASQEAKDAQLAARAAEKEYKKIASRYAVTTANNATLEM
jgi:hypothetical protein